jgi:dTDP-glucose 4,6-dehydratase
MKLLVTGGLGFIGSNFILKLLEQDDIEITNVDAELYGSNHQNLSQIKNSNKYNFVKGNISNKKFMEAQISQCDAVVNFAAESHVDRSINDANPFLVSNIRGAFTILEIYFRKIIC